MSWVFSSVLSVLRIGLGACGTLIGTTLSLQEESIGVGRDQVKRTSPAFGSIVFTKRELNAF